MMFSISERLDTYNSHIMEIADQKLSWIIRKHHFLIIIIITQDYFGQVPKLTITSSCVAPLS